MIRVSDVCYLRIGMALSDLFFYVDFQHLASHEIQVYPTNMSNSSSQLIDSPYMCKMMEKQETKRKQKRKSTLPLRTLKKKRVLP
jgi:hypothetical protein